MKEEEVVQYLLSTPDFFVRHSDVLEGLTLLHPLSGKVVSLLEYQVDALRKSNASYKGEFERLVSVARENESTMQKSRRLILAGLKCHSLDDFSEVVDDMVREEFKISHHSLILFGEYENTAIRSYSSTEGASLLPRVSLMEDSFCGALESEELACIFPDDANIIQSVAVLPLLSRSGDEVKKCGVLVLGADNKTAFDKERGVLFLQYIADLLSAILLRLHS